MPSVAPIRNSTRNAVAVTVECEIVNIKPAVVRNDRKIDRRATLSRCMNPVRSSLHRNPTPSIASAYPYASGSPSWDSNSCGSETLKMPKAAVATVKETVSPSTTRLESMTAQLPPVGTGALRDRLRLGRAGRRSHTSSTAVRPPGT